MSRKQASYYLRLNRMDFLQGWFYCPITCSIKINRNKHVCRVPAEFPTLREVLIFLALPDCQRTMLYCSILLKRLYYTFRLTVCPLSQPITDTNTFLWQWPFCHKFVKENNIFVDLVFKTFRSFYAWSGRHWPEVSDWFKLNGNRNGVNESTKDQQSCSDYIL